MVQTGNNITFEVRLPKNVRISSIDIVGRSVPIDDNWICIVREGYRKLETLPVGAAKQKYGIRR